MHFVLQLLVHFLSQEVNHLVDLEGGGLDWQQVSLGYFLYFVVGILADLELDFDVLCSLFLVVDAKLVLALGGCIKLSTKIAFTHLPFDLSSLRGVDHEHGFHALFGLQGKAGLDSG